MTIPPEVDKQSLVRSRREYAAEAEHKAVPGLTRPKKATTHQAEKWRPQPTGEPGGLGLAEARRSAASKGEVTSLGWQNPQALLNPEVKPSGNLQFAIEHQLDRGG